MIIINVLCEGPTEENFVKKVLAPYFRSMGAIAKGRQVTTNRKLKITSGNDRVESAMPSFQRMDR